MLTEQQISTSIDDAFGADTPRTIDVHPSGAVAIGIRPADHFVSIESTPTQDEWGVSVDPDPATGFLGHDLAFPDLETALTAAQTTVRG